MEKQQLHPAFKLRYTLKGHTNYIYKMALSPDGRMLATPSEDISIRLWDIAEGKLVRILKGKVDPFFFCQWSSDGKRLIANCGYGSNTITIWEPETGKLLNILRIPTNMIYYLAWNSDRQIAAALGNTHIYLINTETGKIIHILANHAEAVVCAAFSPDNKSLCSGGCSNALRLWDIETGTEIRVFQGHKDFIECIVWSSDGKMIISGSNDKTIRIWDAATGKQVQVLEGHNRLTISICLFAKGLLLGSLGEDDRVIIWRTDTWDEVANIEKIGNISSLSNFFLHPDLPVLAVCGSSYREINIWDININLLLCKVAAESKAILPIPGHLEWENAV